MAESAPQDPPRAPAAPRRPRPLRRALALGAALPLLLTLALGVNALRESRTHYEQRAVLLSENLAGAIDLTLGAEVDRIDGALRSIVNHLELDLAQGHLDVAGSNTIMRAQLQGTGAFVSLRVTDARGRGLASQERPGAAPPGTPIGLKDQDFSDRAWFLVQRDQPGVGLYISEPFQSPRYAAPILSFSRRYQDADGHFAGAVTAAVPLAAFDTLLAGFDVGPHGALALRSRALALIAHRPLAPNPRPGHDALPDELRSRAASGRVISTWTTAHTMDGEPRTITLRRLDAAPMWVLVALAPVDYLADWWSELRRTALMGAAAVMLYLGGALLLRRMLLRNRQAQARIDLLAQVFQHGNEAILLVDEHYRIIEANPAFEQLTGYAAAEVCGCDPGLLVGGSDGPETLRRIRAAVLDEDLWRGELRARARDGREIPLWVSISAVRPARDAEAPEAPVSPSADARPPVSHYIASAIDLSDVKAAQERIRHLALTDTLTLLPNRLSLQARLAQAMAEAQRGDTWLAMLVIDMDRFKNINDSLGHHVGDALLIEVAQRLRGLARDGDILARLGGDEFVLVVTGLVAGDAARDQAGALARQVQLVLGAPYPVQGHALHSSPSIGVGLFPADGADPDTLLKNSDTAMYQAKAAGRNAWRFFSPEMNRGGSERLALEAALRVAISQGELRLHFQPQVELASARIVALEALVRWQHPTRGLVPPMEFIPMAEETGQIEALGAWVLDAALAQVATWRAERWPRLRVAVNVSALQMQAGDLPARVAAALARHGLPGQALELEITESTAMSDPLLTIAQLRELQGLGVNLAIDDFGTGYSSLAYLKQLPLNCLKLDRSFVKDIESDPNDAAICRATIQMAHSLGLAVVAEGVENLHQLQYLQDLDCDLIQGYLSGRPLPAEDCAVLLREDLARGAEAARLAAAAMHPATGTAGGWGAGG